MPEFFGGEIKKIVDKISGIKEAKQQKEFYIKVEQEAKQAFQELSDLGLDGQHPITHYSPGNTLELTNQNHFAPGTIFRDKVQNKKDLTIRYHWYHVGGFNPTNPKELVITQAGTHNYTKKTSKRVFNDELPIFQLEQPSKRMAINEKNVYHNEKGKIEHTIGEGSFNDFVISRYATSPERQQFYEDSKDRRQSLGIDIIIAGTAEKKKKDIPQSVKKLQPAFNL